MTFHWGKGKRDKNFTWNVFTAAVAVGKLANVFAAFSSGLIWSRLRIQRLRSRWLVAVDVNELLRVFYDSLWRFQRWPCGTSVNKIRLIIHSFINYANAILTHTEDEFHGRQIVKQWFECHQNIASCLGFYLVVLRNFNIFFKLEKRERENSLKRDEKYIQRNLS